MDSQKPPLASETRRAPRLVGRPPEKNPDIVARGRRREGLGDMYVRLLDASWGILIILMLCFYIVVNTAFAFAYFMIPHAIENARPGVFLDMFFFSVQTLATIGYGKLTPNGILANLLVTLEALIGLSMIAMMTGLAFSKFSRPTARVLFSERAVIALYDNVPHLMLRLANERANRIVNAEVSLVALMREKSREGTTMRRFHDLTPVRARMPVLRLTWTIFHAIDEKSPLYGLDTQALRDDDVEIIVSLTGLDETLSQTIHARYSYLADEIAFGARFEDVLVRMPDGSMEIHYHKFHTLAALPEDPPHA